MMSTPLTQGSPQIQRGKPIYFTQRLTGAAPITLPAPGMFLIKVKVFGGATPGTFAILWNGTGNAHFYGPTNGLKEFAVTWGPLRSATLQAAIFTFGAGVSSVELTFSTKSAGGPDISKYRAILFRRVDGGAVTAAITTSYDEGPNKPKAIVALNSASTGRFQFPSVGGVQQQAECSGTSFGSDPLPAPDLGMPQNNLTLTGISDAAQTIAGVIYY